jgi:hypothetical protein
MSRHEMRDNQASSAMRGATFSRRDMLWAGAAMIDFLRSLQPER